MTPDQLRQVQAWPFGLRENACPRAALRACVGQPRVRPASVRYRAQLGRDMVNPSSSYFDPGCVKTPQARERLELFFPDRPKSIAHNDLCSEIRNRKDDPFYQISTLRRFHTTKTHCEQSSPVHGAHWRPALRSLSARWREFTYS